MIRKKSSFLFQLVASLSPQESQLFLKKSQETGRRMKKIGPELFRVLRKCYNENKHYDEEQVKNQLIVSLGRPANSINSTFPKHKQRLYELILDIFSQQPISQKLESAQMGVEIQRKINWARFLERKSLLQQSFFIYSNILAKAKENEEWAYVLDVLGHLRNHAIAYEEGVYSRLLEIEVEMNKALQNLHEYSQSYMYYHKVAYFIREKYQARDLTLSIPKKPVGLENPQTFLGKLFLSRVEAMIAQIKGDVGHAFTIRKKILGLYEEYPHMKSYRQNGYLISLANMLASCHLFVDLETMERVLGELKSVKIPEAHRKQREEQNQNVLFYSFLLSLNLGEWGRCQELIEEIENASKSYLYRINEARQISFRYNVGLFQFVMGEHEKAWNEFDEIFHLQSSQSHREDLRASALIFRLLILYQRTDFDQLATDIRKVEAAIERNGWMTNFERTLLVFLRKSCQSSFVNEKVGLLNELFQSFMKLKDDGKASRIPGFKEIEAWLLSQIRKKSLKTIIEEGILIRK